jgi:hypothetical protein
LVGSISRFSRQKLVGEYVALHQVHVSAVTIAATTLVAGMALIHNNPSDFESIRAAIEISPERFPGLGPLQLIRCDSLS